MNGISHVGCFLEEVAGLPMYSARSAERYLGVVKNWFSNETVRSRRCQLKILKIFRLLN